MSQEYAFIFERDSDWSIGYCPEVPGANEQGKTLEECRENLMEAVLLILEDRRQDALPAVIE